MRKRRDDDDDDDDDDDCFIDDNELRVLDIIIRWDRVRTFDVVDTNDDDVEENPCTT